MNDLKFYREYQEDASFLKAILKCFLNVMIDGKRIT